VSSPVAPNCVEKMSLIDEYAAASDIYHQYVMLLRNKLDTLPKTGYERVRLRTEEARLRCDAARVALYRHSTEHGC
jgi:hypothetical protein